MDFRIPSTPQLQARFKRKPIETARILAATYEVTQPHNTFQHLLLWGV